MQAHHSDSLRNLIPRLASTLPIGAWVALLVVVGCSSDPESPSATVEDRYCLSDSMMELVTLHEATEDRSRGTLALTGEVIADPDRITHVYAAMAGSVDAIHVRRGDAVRAGQALMDLRSPDLTAFRQEMASARAQVQLTSRSLDLIRSLVASGAAGQREQIEAELAHEHALIEKNRIREQAALLGIDPDSHGGDARYRLTAPRPGVVLDHRAQLRTLLQSTDEPVFTLADLSVVHVVANIYERDIPHVREGASVRLTTLAWPDTVFTGEIQRITRVLHPEKRVAEAIIALPNPDRLLKPGMFARILVERNGGEPSIRIPQSALLFDNDAHHVVVYRDRCDLDIRTVEVLDRLGDDLFLAGELRAGETVVSNKQLLIYHHLMY